MARILLVDDEKNLLEFLNIMLTQEGYNVTVAYGGREAIDILHKNEFDVVITDIKMPRVNGLEVLKFIKENSPDTIVIMITAFASHETAVEAMKAGAYDYITKPFNNDQIKLVIKKAVEKRLLVRENLYLKRKLGKEADSRDIIGKSEKIKEVFDLVEKVAKTNSTVLIYGESGTGKELVARAIHQNSNRTDKPFETINCGALLDTLLESELFGHEKGAFTDAVNLKEGLFEVADGGTLFLDEIAETSPSTQVKLLRVLQEMELKRVGGTKTIKVDVRIIVATNKNLRDRVINGSFREDLFYRINVFPIFMPPLRERTEDIDNLAEFFVDRFCLKLGRKPPQILPQTMEGLKSYAWPGNVRELENVIERVMILCTGNRVFPKDLPEEILKGEKEIISKVKRQEEELKIPEIASEGIDFEKVVGNIEKNLLMEALKKTDGRKTKAAELLKISFRSFRYLLDKYNLG
ncbi:MAG: Fis family transcriptional regulator [Candidatus Schekmanbacteria bacterium RIFCSPHIGHO2_02_FULL_38_11]|uniref:Fis family transcriptional regulator n=1 Tax=Candidatus Schekmanbacteria bacterium RIFCSPLOWO2_12_FULL_38_15 TaxID=1817883 RepID=A0A1F7SHZ5_9BACT|nr:MAG: Fis family transcriptional regulator [Candidatus Schekmanbacteria bacterium GWA2_38_9]OGL48912.1 MAG: Fis family transcriptional regulator [Candidatus Schekmanbacteria bacterium RIFCSPHIGHO2_02_FULL_38_11]OGL49873.1 MAG: Fis family transcriptional regulator [Candidatus Schekmanbacteria bacterium RIFCSPLOWO2_02_FULL_38_14]OGL52787.1 MAG: Fis family transcriptional regulator [Candidatus Schekmanbacteria bacterium RIFCSPLOWO2_12_FULL_38_15]